MLRIKHEFFKNQDFASFYDDDMIIIKDFQKISPLLTDAPFRIDFVLSIVCKGGKMQVKINDETLTVTQNQVILCPINTMISDCLMSSDFQAYTICVSTAYLKDFYLNKTNWQYYNYILHNHIVNFTEEDMNLFNQYFSLIFCNIDNKEKPYRKEILQLLLQTTVYELVTVLDKYIRDCITHNKYSLNDKNLTSRFMELLATSEGKIHSVQEFADHLFVTSNYLSLVVKKSTGENTLTWIHKYMAKEIDRQLHFSDKSIKEICYNLNFPNISFFGKFVLAHLGDTPSKIRKRYQNAK
jgi:AraC family transcriptional activator of pobA